MKKRSSKIIALCLAGMMALPVTAYAGDAKDVTITVYHYMTQENTAVD